MRAPEHAIFPSLRADASVSGAHASIGRSLDSDNGRRPHQGLVRQAPDNACVKALQTIPAAA